MGLVENRVMVSWEQPNGHALHILYELLGAGSLCQGSTEHISGDPGQRTTGPKPSENQRKGKFPLALSSDED